MSDKTYLLVTGQMRSGTTFTCNLLNSQDKVSCFSDYPILLLNEAVKLGIKEINAPLSFEEKNIMLSYVKAEGLQKGIHGLDKTSIEDFSTWYELYCLTLDATIEDEVLVLGSKKTNQTDYLPNF